MFKDYTLQTTQVRALVALACGAVVGSAVSTFPSTIFVPSYVDAANTFQYVSSELTRSFILGFFLWMIFLLSFGTPAWLLAHFKGYRGWGSALFVGFFVPFVVFFGFKHVYILKMGIDFGSAVWDSASFAIHGVPVALTIWFLAYKWPRPRPC